jgi:biotin carboxyl carrier protein
VALTLLYRDRPYKVQTVDRRQVSIEGQLYEVRQSQDGIVRVSKAETRSPAQTAASDVIVVSEHHSQTAWVAARGTVRWVFLNGRAYELSELQPANRRRGTRHDTTLTAPMPATVRRIVVGVGDAVQPGDPLLVLEAMKMELPIRAAVAGTVRSIGCREGELVQPGVALIEIDAST